MNSLPSLEDIYCTSAHSKVESMGDLQSGFSHVASSQPITSTYMHTRQKTPYMQHCAYSVDWVYNHVVSGLTLNHKNKESVNLILNWISKLSVYYQKLDDPSAGLTLQSPRLLSGFTPGQLLSFKPAGSPSY